MPSCTVCGKRAYSDYCVQHKPRKPIATHKPTLSSIRKAINPRGKHANKWAETKKAWFKAHSHQPYYECHYCHAVISKREITLDHKVPRSRAPELRYDFDNLVPSCWTCNGLKGSVAHDDYLHECHV